MDNKNISAGLFAIALGIFFLILCIQLPSEPAFFPRVISVALIIIGSLGLAPQIYLKNKFKNTNSLEDDKKTNNWYKELKILPLILVAVIYVILFRKLGYLIVTPLLIIFSGWYLGYKKFPVLISVSLGVSIVFFIVFGTIMQVLLPKIGIFGF